MNVPVVSVNNSSNKDNCGAQSRDGTGGKVR